MSLREIRSARVDAHSKDYGYASFQRIEQRVVERQVYITGADAFDDDAIDFFSDARAQQEVVRALRHRHELNIFFHMVDFEVELSFGSREKDDAVLEDRAYRTCVA